MNAVVGLFNDIAALVKFAAINVDVSGLQNRRAGIGVIVTRLQWLIESIICEYNPVIPELCIV
jgi:hypothetical protein